MDYDVIANQPVVIDNGSGSIKAGFAGGQSPKVRFANFVGRPKHTRVMAGALEGDMFIGPKAEEYRGLLSLKYPMEHGIVTDWNDMEKVWQYIYSQEQMNIFPEEHPVLLTEAPLNPMKHKEKAAEIFFESFNVPALHIQMQAVLSLYSSGRTTGVVLDSGDGVTHVVPIYEGFAVDHAIGRMDVAGRDVTRWLRLLLRKEGTDLHRTSEFEIVREIKEKACYLATNVVKEEANENDKDLLTEANDTQLPVFFLRLSGDLRDMWVDDIVKDFLSLFRHDGRVIGLIYPLPDGSRLEIGASRFRAPEVLFRPELIGEEWPGIAQLVNDSIRKCDMDVRKTLYGSIILSGGSTLFQGFGDRLLSEMRRLSPQDTKVRITAPQERLYSTWIGGSILASLDTFRKLWVSKKEYEDEGKKILHRKFF